MTMIYATTNEKTAETRCLLLPNIVKSITQHEEVRRRFST